jgi:hypothetical protein
VTTRRNLLRGALVAAIAAPLTTALRALPAAAATNLPITVVNDTGRYANDVLWMYIVGTDPTTGRQCFVNSDGALIGNATVNLPNMSGRMYFSVNDKLPFKVVTDGNGNPALQYPAGWVSSDPSYTVLHDWIEFTFNGSGMFCNTTMVDMFSVPLAITLTGQSSQTTGQLAGGGRAAIFSAIAALPDFSGLIIGDDLRVIAPGHGIQAGVFSSTYYDGYISDVWSQYTSNTVSVTINGTV